MNFLEIMGGIVLLAILILVVHVLIWVLIIRLIIDYAARRFAEETAKQQTKAYQQQIDYLAERIAEEMNKQHTQWTEAAVENT